MGKPYASEIASLPETHDWAMRTPLGRLEDFCRSTRAATLLATGSGGSLAAAALAAHLHRATGNPAYYLTPQMLQWEGARCATLLISASGGNRDILGALEAAGSPTGVLCAKPGSRLARAGIHHTVAAEPPSGRDGFLAVNTLLAFCVWLARAYGRYNLDWRGLVGGSAEPAVNGIAGKRHLLLLADAASWPAAVDLESRLHESGLASAQVADWRNFAHGRHNWLALHGCDTGVVALSTPQSALLAYRTLRLLPGGIPVVRLETGHRGAAAPLHLLAKSMVFAGLLGGATGMDIGRPVVPDFGRRLYRLD